MAVKGNRESGKDVVALGMAISEIESLLDEMGGYTNTDVTISELCGLTPEGGKRLRVTATMLFDQSKLSEYFARKPPTDQ